MTNFTVTGLTVGNVVIDGMNITQLVSVATGDWDNTAAIQK